MLTFPKPENSFISWQRWIPLADHHGPADGQGTIERRTDLVDDELISEYGINKKFPKNIIHELLHTLTLILTYTLKDTYISLTYHEIPDHPCCGLLRRLIG